MVNTLKVYFRTFENMVFVPVGEVLHSKAQLKQASKSISG
jgi:hypothetical protein